MPRLLDARPKRTVDVFITTLGRGIPTTNALTLRRVHDPRKNDAGPDEFIWPRVDS